MFRQQTQPASRESTPRLGSRDLGVTHYFERCGKSDRPFLIVHMSEYLRFFLITQYLISLNLKGCHDGDVMLHRLIKMNRLSFRFGQCRVYLKMCETMTKVWLSSDS